MASVTPKPTAKPTPTATMHATPTQAPTQTPTQEPPSGGNPAKENQMIALVNQARADAGLPALSYSSMLRKGALKHSNDMSMDGFFDHTSPTYGTFPERFNAAGFVSGAENIALYGSIESAHEGLMKSEGHRDNILSTKYKRIGIGIVYNEAKRKYYITQWFSK